MRSKFIIFLSCAFVFAILTAANAAQTKTVKPFHKEAGLTCEDCHGTKTPNKVATEENCLSCHESREAVEERTKKDDPNPHFGHDGSIGCNDCHKEHEMSVLYCDQCHQWGYTTP